MSKTALKPRSTKNDAIKIKIDRARDSLLTEFGKTVLTDRYLMDGESYQDLFARVAVYYADNQEHAQRIYDYISSMWFMPATPILSNGGTNRGLPISCFLNEVEDGLADIIDNWAENAWLASYGGGIGTYWGNVRSMGEDVRGKGKSSGSIPFIVTQNAQTSCISQGLLRRGSVATYMPISHPEIEEFIDIRRPSGGDPSRKAPNIHHGVVISDAFMYAVENDEKWDLVSPKTGKVIHTHSARDLWVRLLLARIETGEPYMLFIDNVNNNSPQSYKKLDLKVKTSNLCSEIMLTTGRDHLNESRTAVCCLSSLNLEHFEEWRNNPMFIEDIMRFLDNILQDFIDRAPDSMSKARYSAYRERSVGLGVMGLHSFLQSQRVPMASVVAKSWNKIMFKHIREEADKASIKLAQEKGPCPDAEELGIMERFTHKIAVAPTASISVICGNSSPGIEPYNANAFTQKTLSGSFNVKNKHLQALLKEKDMDVPEVWSSIMNHEGSVQQFNFLTQDEREVFQTSFEIDQRWLIDLTADRTHMIDQGQSVNLFLSGNIHKRDLHMLHYTAWKKGIKSLYYCRSKSMQRADTVSIKKEKTEMKIPEKYEECLSCQ